MLLPEEEREQLRGSFSSGSDPLSKDVANIGAATPPNPPQKKSGSNRSPISFSKSTLLFLKLYRKLSKGRGEKINEVGLLARARTFEADSYAEKKAILDRLTAEEKLLTAKGLIPVLRKHSAVLALYGNGHRLTEISFGSSVLSRSRCPRRSMTSERRHRKFRGGLRLHQIIS